MRFRLVPLEGGNPIELIRDLTVVGRKEDCDLRLDNKSVSKFHCILVKAENTLLVRDLGSTNGTRVNGQRVRRATLHTNDHLNIANLPFKVLVTSGSGEAPANINQNGCTIQINNQDEAERIANSNSDSIKMNGDEIVQSNDLPDEYPKNG